jgi:hypothetical protein
VFSVVHNLLYQFAQYPVRVERVRFRKQILAELLSMDHRRAPCMHRWTIYGAVHSVTNCRHCTKFDICYLNADVSTPVLRSSSIIMCNWNGVSSENLVMQGY